MCTVTFSPGGKIGFTLTSNRDEKPERPLADPPRRYSLHNRIVVFPKDPQANGTWIAMANRGLCLCLLNGAFNNHVHQPSYRKSRGLVVLDFFQYASTSDFIGHYDFMGIAPFTLLVVQSLDVVTLVEIRWDGQQVHTTPKDASQAHIWSSATLYPPPVQALRAEWYASFLERKPSHSQNDLLDFHRFAGKEDSQNGLCINRAHSAQTVSITSIASRGDSALIMTYEDLVGQTTQNYRLM